MLILIMTIQDGQPLRVKEVRDNDTSEREILRMEVIKQACIQWTQQVGGTFIEVSRIKNEEG